jgi:hypothetical protein
MPPDDTPLVIESGNELPARDEQRIVIIGCVVRVERAADSERRTSRVQPQNARFSTLPLSKEVSRLPERPSPSTLLQRRTHKYPA